MAKLQNHTKDNPKLEQRPLKDGRISLYLKYYLGRTETPAVDEDGNPVLYTSGAMVGKPKVKITHLRKKEKNFAVLSYCFSEDSCGTATKQGDS